MDALACNWGQLTSLIFSIFLTNNLIILHVDPSLNDKLPPHKLIQSIKDKLLHKYY